MIHAYHNTDPFLFLVIQHIILGLSVSGDTSPALIHSWTFEKAVTPLQIFDDVTNSLATSSSQGVAIKQYSNNKRYISLNDNGAVFLSSPKDCLGHFKLCTNGFTISFWWYAKPTSKPQYVLNSVADLQSEDCICKQLELTFHKSNINVTIWVNNTASSVVYPVLENVWNQHTIVWMPGNRIKVFLNGNRLKEETSTFQIDFEHPVFHYFFLGKKDFNINADVDEIKFWNASLTKREVAKNYENIIDVFHLDSKCTNRSTTVCVQWSKFSDVYNIIAKKSLIVQSSTSQREEMTLSSSYHCISALQPLTAYTVVAMFVLNNGKEWLSNTVMCHTTDGIPNPPVRLNVTVVNRTLVTVSWAPPVVHNGVIIQYEIDIYKYERHQFSHSFNVSTDAFMFGLHDLSPSTTYFVSMASRSSLGVGRSVEVKFQSPPNGEERFIPVHGFLLVEATSESVSFKWESSGIDYNYKLNLAKEGDSKQRVFETTATSFKLEGLIPSTHYFIKIGACLRNDCEQQLSGDSVMVKTLDKNECLDSYDNLCDPMATCENTESSYICYCRDGFFGDGFVCREIPAHSPDLTVFCQEVEFAHVKWPAIYNGDTAIVRCPRGSDGCAQRYCHHATIKKPAHYGLPDFSKCVSKRIMEVEKLVYSNQGSFAMHELENITASSHLYGGDLIKCSQFTKKILEKKFTSLNEADEMGQTIGLLTSNMLDTRQHTAWDFMPADKKKSTAESLIANYERTGILVVNTFANCSYTSVQKNAVLKVQSSSEVSSLVANGYKIHLAAENQSGSSRMVILAKYNHITKFLQTPNDEMSVSEAMVTASFEGEEYTKLEVPIKITVPHPQGFVVSKPTCVYWNATTSSWSGNGCEVNATSVHFTVCQCYHLTNFALLMSLTEAGTNAILSSGHDESLHIITIIGLSVSIIALLLALFAFLTFRFMRSTRTLFHRYLAISLLVASLLLILGMDKTENQTVCGVVAAMLEYFYLSAFLWMLIEGVLLYLMLSEVFKKRNILLNNRYFQAACWVLPGVYVGLLYAIFPQHYGTEKYCWISFKDGFIWTFIAPVLIVIFFNLLVTMLAFRVMASRKKSKTDGTAHQIWYWLKGCLVISFLLGTTWVFGLLHVNSASIVFAYIFSVLNAFQGLFIFVFHCWIIPEVRVEFLRILRCQPRSVFNEKAGYSSSMRYRQLSSSGVLNGEKKQLSSISVAGSNKSQAYKQASNGTLNNELKPLLQSDVTGNDSISLNSKADVEDLVCLVQCESPPYTVVDVNEDIEANILVKKKSSIETFTVNPSDIVAINDNVRDNVAINDNVRDSVVIEPLNITEEESAPWRFSVFDKIDEECENDIKRRSLEMKAFMAGANKPVADDMTVNTYQSTDDLLQVEDQREAIITPVSNTDEFCAPDDTEPFQSDDLNNSHDGREELCFDDPDRQANNTVPIEDDPVSQISLGKNVQDGNDQMNEDAGNHESVNNEDAGNHEFVNKEDAENHESVNNEDASCVDVSMETPSSDVVGNVETPRKDWDVRGAPNNKNVDETSGEDCGVKSAPNNENEEETPGEDCGVRSTPNNKNVDETPGEDCGVKSAPNNKNAEETPVKDCGVKSAPNNENVDETPGKDCGVRSTPNNENVDETPVEDCGVRSTSNNENVDETSEEDCGVKSAPNNENAGETPEEDCGVRSTSNNENVDETSEEDCGVKSAPNNENAGETPGEDCGVRSTSNNENVDETSEEDCGVKSAPNNENAGETPEEDCGIKSEPNNENAEETPVEDCGVKSAPNNENAEETPEEECGVKSALNNENLAETSTSDEGLMPEEEGSIEEANIIKNGTLPYDELRIAKELQKEDESSKTEEEKISEIEDEQKAEDIKDDENNDIVGEATVGEDQKEVDLQDGRKMEEQAEDCKLPKNKNLTRLEEPENRLSIPSAIIDDFKNLMADIPKSSAESTLPRPKLTKNRKASSQGSSEDDVMRTPSPPIVHDSIFKDLDEEIQEDLKTSRKNSVASPTYRSHMEIIQVKPGPSKVGPQENSANEAPKSPKNSIFQYDVDYKRTVKQ